MNQPVIKLTAIDCHNTVRKENGFAIEKKEEGWLLQVAVLDPVESLKAPRNQRSTFSKRWESQSVILSFSIHPTQGSKLVDVCKAPCILDRAFVDNSELNLGKMSKVSETLNELLPMVDILLKTLHGVEGTGNWTKFVLGHMNSILMNTASKLTTAFMVDNNRRVIYARKPMLSQEPANIADLGHARFTAPMRRIDDLVNIACLQAAWRKEPEIFLAHDMQKIQDQQPQRKGIPVPIQRNPNLQTDPTDYSDLALWRYTLLVQDKINHCKEWSERLAYDFVHRIRKEKITTSLAMDVLGDPNLSSPYKIRKALVSTLKDTTAFGDLYSIIENICIKRNINSDQITFERSQSEDGYYTKISLKDVQELESSADIFEEQIFNASATEETQRRADRVACERLICYLVKVEQEVVPNKNKLALVPVVDLHNYCATHKLGAQQFEYFKIDKQTMGVELKIDGYPMKFSTTAPFKKYCKEHVCEIALHELKRAAEARIARDNCDRKNIEWDEFDPLYPPKDIIQQTTRL